MAPALWGDRCPWIKKILSNKSKEWFFFPLQCEFLAWAGRVDSDDAILHNKVNISACFCFPWYSGGHRCKFWEWEADTHFIKWGNVRTQGPERVNRLCCGVSPQRTNTLVPLNALGATSQTENRAVKAQDANACVLIRWNINDLKIIRHSLDAKCHYSTI